MVLLLDNSDYCSQGPSSYGCTKVQQEQNICHLGVYGVSKNLANFSKL